MNFRVVLSTGNGRLHLVTAAKWLRIAGVDIRVIQGWVPQHWKMGFVRFVGRIIKAPNLAFGMALRSPDELVGRIDSCADAEFLLQIMTRCARFIPGRLISPSIITALCWRYFGWSSKRFLKNADVFHVRSGAGQGDAIRLARERGMKILIDHSAAHPAWMKKNLEDEYLRHGFRLEMGIDNPFWKIILKDCRDSDLVMVNSNFVKETFVASGFNDDRIKVVYLGVRRDFNALRDWEKPFRKTENRPIHILFTGSFSFHKGAEYVLRAVRLLNRSNMKLVLTIVGSNSAAFPILSQYEDLKHVLRIVGHVPQDSLKKYLSEADIYLFPSLAEGCAQSGMEAMSAGLCVVATRESGLPIIDEETGFIIPAMNAEAIVDRIEWLVRNPVEMARVGRNASRQLASFTWEKYAENVIKVYQKLLERDAAVHDKELSGFL